MKAQTAADGTETVDYARSMLKQLQEMAQAEGHDMLAYLIEMAQIEASDILRGGRPTKIGLSPSKIAVDQGHSAA